MKQTEIGSALSDLREVRGWTRAQLAEKIGVTERSVRAWEQGERTPMFYIMPSLEAFISQQIKCAGKRQTRKKAG